MNSSLKLASRSFPSRVADLGFTTDLPVDWISHDLPQETDDISNPATFIPLAVITAPHAALIFAFAARPAHDDGTLHDWAWFHLKHQEMQPRAIGPAVVASVAALAGEAVKDSEMGPMVVRFAFFEDGGRLVCLTFSAPELLADTVREAWFGMLRSFRLESPRGSRFAVDPQVVAATAPESTPENSADEPASPAATSDPAPESDAVFTAEPHAPATLPHAAIEMPLSEGLRPRKCRFADFALAEDASTLDPEHAINANLRDRGIGLVPNVTQTSVGARRARVAAGALEAFVDVPFGWHVIDDGRRTLIFEPSGKVQVNLDLVPRDDRDDDTILDAIEADATDAYPAPHFSRRTDGIIRTLTVQNIVDGDQPLAQHHLLRAGRDDTRVVRARVTATPEESADAWILGTLILESCVFPVAQEDEEPAGEPLEPRPKEGPVSSTSTAASSRPPAWWTRALELEAQDQLEAAENTIRDGCPYIGFAMSTAEMYRQRMNRLKAAGDRAGALDAFKRSSDFISFYASMATSGGEGAALSYERDQFRAQLVAEYGCDPEARCA